MAVADRIEVSELRGGLSRFHRLKGFAPPRRVLLEFCREALGYRIEDNTIIADPAPPDWMSVLGETEQTMVGLLRKFGPLLPTEEFEKRCLEAGMNRATFWQYLQYSPIIERYSPGIYGLRGETVPAGLIESLTRKRRRTTVLKGYGWMKDGKIWLGYRLSKALVGNGVPSTPSGLKNLIEGEFTIKTPDGSTFGKFVSKASGAWGLGPFFRRRGAEAGDFLLLILDITTRVTVAFLGDESLLENPDITNELAEPTHP